MKTEVIKDYIKLLIKKAEWYDELSRKHAEIMRSDSDPNARLYQGYSSAILKVIKDIADIYDIDMSDKLSELAPDMECGFLKRD